MEIPTKIPIKRSQLDWILEALALLSLFLSVYPLFFYEKLPERIPTRFNIEGEAVQWAGRGMLWFLAVMALAIYVAISFLQKYPERMNYPVEIKENNLPKAYALMLTVIILTKLLMTLMLGSLNYNMYSIATEHVSVLSPGWFILAMIAGFIAVAIYPIVRLSKLK